MDKKGQAAGIIGTLPALVLTFVIVGVFLGIGAIVLQEMRDTESLRERQTWNDTAVTLTNNTVTGAACKYVVGCVDLENASDGDQAFCCANFTVNTTAQGQGFTLSGTDAAFAGAPGTFNVIYTCDADTEASLAVNASLLATSDIADWLDIVVVVAIAGIILSLVAVFGFGVGRSRR